jgi:hypothetical protein
MTAIQNSTRNDRNVRISKLIDSGREDVTTFNLDQVLRSSLQWADAYTSNRHFEKVGMTPDATTTIAAARLEWLLQEGRRTLSGVISVRDFVVLCNTFQMELAIPEDYASLASQVANDNGLDTDNYQESGMGPLLDKLMGLSVLQSAALRDLVERYWYIGVHASGSIEMFLKENGLTLTDD